MEFAHAKKKPPTPQDGHYRPLPDFVDNQLPGCPPIFLVVVVVHVDTDQTWKETPLAIPEG